MLMNRAIEMLEYLGEYPPANVTLALVHLKREAKSSRKTITESEAMSGLGQLSSQIGSAPRPLPEHLREMASWAHEQLNRHAK